MPKITPYVQRYKVKTPRVTADDFGAAKGRILAHSGEKLTETAQMFAKIEQKKQSRADVIENVRGIRDFNQLNQQEITRLENEDDMTSTKVSETYNAFVTQNIGTLTENYQGSNEGRDRLEAQLIALGDQYSQNVYKMNVSAQYEAVKNIFEEQKSKFSAQAYIAPDKIGDTFSSIDETVKGLSSALPEGQEKAFANDMKIDAVKSATRSFIVAGEFVAASELLHKYPDITLSPNDYRSLNTEIIVGERKFQKEKQKLVKKITQTEHILDRPLTENEKLRMSTIPFAGELTVLEETHNLEKVLGRELSVVESQKMFNVYQQSKKDTFGTSLTGKLLNVVDNNVVGFANNSLTPEQEQQFSIAVNQLTQPVTFQNPDTGVMETRTYRLPLHVVEAYERRGMPLPSQNRQGDDVDVNQPLDSDEPIDESDKLFHNIVNIAGPIPAVGRFVGKIPFNPEGGGDYTRVYTQARLMQRDLVRILQNNPRYAEGERKSVEEDLSILSSPFDSIADYRERLVALDTTLAIREKNAYNTAQNSKVSSLERRHAANVANGIVKFREYLGVPPRVKTVEESMKLPVGALFITPTGGLRRRIEPKPTKDDESKTDVSDE